MASVHDFLESEVIDKSRTVLYSSLSARFELDKKFQTGIKSFISKFGQNVKVLIVFTAGSGSGSEETLEIKLRSIDSVEFESKPFEKLNVFAFRPTTSEESSSSIWKREMEEVRQEMASNRKDLWQSKNAVVIHPSTERNLSVSFQPPPPVATSKPPVSVVKDKPETKKFQVPLDKLDDDKDEKMSIEKDNEEAKLPAPEIALTISSSSVAGEEILSSNASPQAKRPRVEEAAESIESSSRASGSEPQFREVTIKKKVVVTEYAMGPNGEMIVKDVEKMIEETKLEPVMVMPSNSSKSSRSQPFISRTGGEKDKKKEPKASAPGQGKLTSFFKAKN